MKNAPRLLLASGIASLIAPAIFTAFTVYSGDTGPWVMTSFVLAWMVTVLHLLLLGLPVSAFLRRWSWSGWPALSAAGFAAGFLPVGVLTAPPLDAGALGVGNWTTWVAMCWPFGLLGTLTAMALRGILLALERRPGRPA